MPKLFQETAAERYLHDIQMLPTEMVAPTNSNNQMVPKLQIWWINGDARSSLKPKSCWQSSQTLHGHSQYGWPDHVRMAPGHFHERVDETPSPSMLWAYPKIIFCVSGNDPFKNDPMVKQNLKFRRDNVLWNISSVQCKFNGDKQAFVGHFVKATFSAFVHTLHRHCSGVTSSLAEL